MKTIVYHRYGSPDVLKCEDIDKPTAGDDEVLIKVRAASVNPLDWHFMRGTPYIVRIMAGLRKPKITRLGVDVAGQVESVGRNMSSSLISPIHGRLMVAGNKALKLLPCARRPHLCGRGLSTAVFLGALRYNWSMRLRRRVVIRRPHLHRTTALIILIILASFRTTAAAVRIEVARPLESVVAHPFIRIAATCSSDDPGGCASLEAFVGSTQFGANTRVAAGQARIDDFVSLSPQFDGSTATLVFRAKDATGAQATLIRTVFVESSPRLVEFFRIREPGQITVFDLNSERILFRQNLDTGSTLRIRPLSGDQDIVLPPTPDPPLYGYLSPTGTIFVAQRQGLKPSSPHFYSWFDGTLKNLGEGFYLRVSGDYAAIIRQQGDTSSPGTLVRLDLRSGEEAVVARGLAPFDLFFGLASNGDVVHSVSTPFSTGYLNSNIYRYRSRNGKNFWIDGSWYRALGRSLFRIDRAVPLSGPDLAIDISQDGNLTVGAIGSYTLAVANVGSSPTSERIIVSNSLPDGLQYVSASGEGWGCSRSAGVMNCVRDEPVAPNTAAPTIKLKVNVMWASSPVTNTAVVAADDRAGLDPSATRRFRSRQCSFLRLRIQPLCSAVDLRLQYPAIFGYAFVFPFVCLLLAILFARSEKSGN